MAKSIKIETGYMHALGPVVICTGIGGPLYGAYARKPNGSLKRIIPIRQYHDPADVLAELDAYQGTAVWKPAENGVEPCQGRLKQRGKTPRG